MARKYKLTGCAKFFIFFIIAAPVAYVAASYYNGQDPIREAREFFASFFDSQDEGGEDIASPGFSETRNEGGGTVYQEMELKDLKIKNLERDLEDCEALNTKQSDLIEAQKKEITHLKQQLGGSQ